MSYRRLGFSCDNQTIACTTNHKYLSPLDPVYFKQFTYMAQYPAAIPSFVSRDSADPRHPSKIKSYFGKTDIGKDLNPSVEKLNNCNC